jgi:hypothetical protein
MISAFAQAPGNGIRIGLGIFGVNYIGDFTEKDPYFFRIHPGGNLSIQGDGPGRLQLQANLGYGFFSEQLDNRRFDPPEGVKPNSFVTTTFFATDLRMKFRFFRKKNIQPYVQAGAGLLVFSPKDEKGRFLSEAFVTRAQGETYGTFTPQFPVAFGIQGRINSSLSIGIDYSYRFTSTDYLDNIGQLGFRKGNDALQIVQIALHFHIAPAKPEAPVKPKPEPPVREPLPVIAGITSLVPSLSAGMHYSPPPGIQLRVPAWDPVYVPDERDPGIVTGLVAISGIEPERELPGMVFSIRKLPVVPYTSVDIRVFQSLLSLNAQLAQEFSPPSITRISGLDGLPIPPNIRSYRLVRRLPTLPHTSVDPRVYQSLIELNGQLSREHSLLLATEGLGIPITPFPPNIIPSPGIRRLSYLPFSSVSARTLTSLFQLNAGFAREISLPFSDIESIAPQEALEISASKNWRFPGRVERMYVSWDTKDRLELENIRLGKLFILEESPVLTVSPPSPVLPFPGIRIGGFPFLPVDPDLYAAMWLPDPLIDIWILLEEDAIENQNVFYYLTKKGDTYEYLYERFRIREATIQIMNNLSSPKVPQNTTLIIPDIRKWIPVILSGRTPDEPGLREQVNKKPWED